MIQVADELQGYNKDRAFKNAGLIYDILLQIFAIAKKENIATSLAADIMLDSKIETIGRIQRKYTR